MPQYDWNCKKCDKETTLLLSFDEYDAQDGVNCKYCGTHLIGDDRIIGRGLKTIVTGPGKGNHNSNDWS